MENIERIEKNVDLLTQEAYKQSLEIKKINEKLDALNENLRALVEIMSRVAAK